MNLPDGWKLDLLIPPASEPVTLPEAKNYARVEIADDDDLIESLIVAARIQVEHRTRRALLPQQWRLSFDGPIILPITLPKPPIISVDAISYRTSSGSFAPVDLSKLVVGLGTPGQINHAPLAYWCPPLPQIGGCQIDFTAGYADVDHVPANVKLAIKWLVNFWYVHRSEDGVIPDFVDRLLSPSFYMSYP